MKTPMKTVELLERPTEAFKEAIAPDESEYTPSVRTLEYLQAVARRAELDFIPQELKRPVASPVSAIKLIAEQASPPSQEFQELRGRAYAAYYHSGLNE